LVCQWGISCQLAAARQAHAQPHLCPVSNTSPSAVTISSVVLMSSRLTVHLARAGAAFTSPSKPLATGGKRDRRLQVCKTASVVHRLEGLEAVLFAVQGVRVVSDWHPSYILCTIMLSYEHSLHKHILLFAIAHIRRPIDKEQQSRSPLRGLPSPCTSRLDVYAAVTRARRMRLDASSSMCTSEGLMHCNTQDASRSLRGV
jgi:hypothetical protein